MEIDLRTLARFHEMARRGAEKAASRLTEFTGVETELGVTKIKFVTTREIQREFDVDVEHVSVSTNLAGGPGGHSVVVFDEPSARKLTDSIFSVIDPSEFDEAQAAPTNGDGESIDLESDKTKHVSPELRRSALKELSNMLGCAFVDGWADVLNTDIDVSAPHLRSGKNSKDVFGNLERVGRDTEIALMFESGVKVSDTEINFAHFLFPSIGDLEEMVNENSSPTIDGFDFEKLIGFDAMVEEGAEKAANSMAKLTGCDTSVDIRHLNFVRIDQLSKDLPVEPRIGVAFEYTGLPSGYLLFLFSEESAKGLVNEMLPKETDEPFGQAGQSALQELGNILSSRIIDGWANVLDTQIDHTPPEYVHDIAPAIVDPIVAQVGQDQEYAFSFDTTLVADDAEFDCEIYSVCEHGDLEDALRQLNLDRLHHANKSVGFPLEGVEQDPDSIDTMSANNVVSDGNSDTQQDEDVDNGAVDVDTEI